jgi:hypothetical protein
MTILCYKDKVYLIHDSQQNHLALQFIIIQTKIEPCTSADKQYLTESQSIYPREKRITTETEENCRTNYNRLTHLNLFRLGEFFVSNKWNTTFLL